VHLVSYRQGESGRRIGVLRAGAVIDAVELLPADDGPDLTDMRSLLASGPELLDRLAAQVPAADDEAWAAAQPVELVAPISDPPRIFAIGRNYAEHAREGGADVPDFPMLFFKPATSLVGPGAAIVIPPSTQRVDWEGELAVVIGSGGKYVSEDQALEHVAGYSVANDVSARDWQRRTTQFDAGKMFDTFCPLGPAIVVDRDLDPQDLRITTTVNGQVMQDGWTGDMIFPVARLVSYLSEAVALLPGDIILTGTPAGVGYARPEPIFLAPGDVVEVEISRVGRLSNPVVAERV
jgi:acylpyruvate hydrolase